jgi:hypothetical protein
MIAQNSAINRTQIKRLASPGILFGFIISAIVLFPKSLFKRTNFFPIRKIKFPMRQAGANQKIFFCKKKKPAT